MFRDTVDDFKRECKDELRINVKEFVFDETLHSNTN